MTPSKQLTADGLFEILYTGFAEKDRSLLEFDKRRLSKESNLQTIYGTGRVPSDSQMRTILDLVSPSALKPL